MYCAFYPNHPIFCDPFFSSPEYATFFQEMQIQLSITSPQKDSYIITIQKVISYIDNYLHIMQSEMQIEYATLTIGQNMLVKKVKRLTVTLNDFTSGHFQLIFTSKKSRILSQDFDYIFHRCEKLFSLSLHITREILPPSTPVSSLNFFSP